MPLYDFRCPTCGQVYEVTRSVRRQDDPLLCMVDNTPCERVTESTPTSGANAGVEATSAADWFRYQHRADDWSGGHAHAEGTAYFRDVLPEMRQAVGGWIDQLRAAGMRKGDALFACVTPAIEMYGTYESVLDDEGRRIPLGGDAHAAEPFERGYLAYVWAAISHAALARAIAADMPSAIAEPADALETDALLTALMLLWTLTTAEDFDPAAATGAPPDDGLAASVVESFTVPFGIRAEDWDGRIVHIEAEVVQLLSVWERASYLFAPEAAEALARLRAQPGAALDVPDGALRLRPDATMLDRVHAAMLLEACGRLDARRAAMPHDEAGRAEFLRLATVLSRLYSAGREERRLIDAMLAAVSA